MPKPQLTKEKIHHYEESARALRTRVGVGPYEPFDPLVFLPKLGVVLKYPDEVSDLPEDLLTEIRGLDAKEWSGMAKPLPKGKLFVILNRNQTLERKGISTANKCRVVLHHALKQAVRYRLISVNPVNAVDRLKENKRDLKLWTPEEAERFLDVAMAYRLYALFYLAMAAGLRRGELLGLRWQDITPTAISVNQQLTKVKRQLVLGPPKSRSGKRRVPITANVVAVLEMHREQQALERATLEVQPPATDLVFISEIGTLLDPDNLRRVREQLMALAEVPPVSLHDLRHLHASIAIKHGTDAKVLADRLGHARASFTLDRYTHLFEEQRAASAVSLLAFLPQKTQQSN